MNILVDFDNTLIDYDITLYNILYKLCSELKIELKKRDYLYFKKLTKYLWENYEEECISNLNKKRFSVFFNIVDRNQLEEIINRYKELRKQECVIFNDTIPFLKIQKRHKNKIIIVTNGCLEIQKSLIDKYNLNQFISHIISADSVGFKKPDIRFFEKLDIKNKQNFILVGDSLDEDIESAMRLNIKAIWINRKKLYNKELHSSVTEVNSLLEIGEV